MAYPVYPLSEKNIYSSVIPYASAISPDGKWIAFVSDESGQDEVYVVSNPKIGNKWLISKGGGIEPVWAQSGREMFNKQEEKLYSVSLNLDRELKILDQNLIFEDGFTTGLYGMPNYDVSPDGTKFLTLQSRRGDNPEIKIMLNWLKTLKTTWNSELDLEEPPPSAGAGKYRKNIAKYYRSNRQRHHQ